MNLLDQIIANTSPGTFFAEQEETTSVVSGKLVRLIAFYLPQFHPIAENDAWWGAGFTEWTNVTKAVPRFAGQYQPRLPGALGFYDATQPNTLERQAALAKQYGIGGFCFHHYWFGGKRVLQKPLEVLLANPEIDLPFCVNWANENWTRRWDGREKQVLLEQTYSPEDDIAFARSLEPLFRDRRYIKIRDRPLLLVYRPGLFPDAKQTVARWRDHFTSVGIGDPYIVSVQTLGSATAEAYGMDAAAGFPPFWKCFDIPMLKNVELFDPKFTGAARDYRTLADATIAGYSVDKKVFPGVVPSWDNEARMPGRGISFPGSTPVEYGRWLRAACVASMRAFVGDERLVFINAWNEWAEGAYLEPDRHFGFAYLSETRRVLNSLTSDLVDVPLVEAGNWSAPRLKFRQRVKRPIRRVLNNCADLVEDFARRLRGKR